MAWDLWLQFSCRGLSPGLALLAMAERRSTKEILFIAETVGREYDADLASAVLVRKMPRPGPFFLSAYLVRRGRWRRQSLGNGRAWSSN